MTTTHSETRKPIYPGWVARCTKCDYEVDLASLGWVRRGAYSYGKRSAVYCETCEKTRFMQIIHVDENGEPDQPFWKVLLIVLSIQVVVWGSLAVLYFLFRDML